MYLRTLYSTSPLTLFQISLALPFKIIKLFLTTLASSLFPLTFQSSSVIHESALFQLRRLDSYRREIRLVREQRDEEGGRERDAVKEILVVWKKLKDARKAQGYRNTSVKLV